jgi:uncharacterized protein YprB with RNaseH-like and TPR domain
MSARDDIVAELRLRLARYQQESSQRPPRPVTLLRASELLRAATEQAGWGAPGKQLPERELPLCAQGDAPAPPTVEPSLLEALDAAGGVLEQTRILDTETTGLAGGTGTLAFLVGVGWWEGGRFRVDQLLLQRPSDEPELLERLDALLAGAGLLVTFNGRTFDLPLLRTRYLMNRRSSRALAAPHLDLLHPARRLFRGRVADCRLQTLEALVLGRRRVAAEDVDGAEIPARYQSYLRTGDRHALDAVIKHNRIDVASTAWLLGRVLRGLGEPLEWAEDGFELLAAAETWLRVADHTRADAALERGLSLARSAPARRRLLRLRARLAQRRGHRQLAATLWEQYRQEFPRENLGFVETAKIYEHHDKDVVSALARARAAPNRGPDVIHRIARLERRRDRLTSCTLAARLASFCVRSPVDAGSSTSTMPRISRPK